MRYLSFILASALLVAACNSETNTTTSHSDSTHATDAGTESNTTGASHMKTMHDAMNNMMQQMQNMKPTGDPDHDFAMMMKHHHMGAVDMIRSELEGGADEEMKQKAQKMLDEQQKEIAVFDKFLQGHTPQGSSDYGQRAMGMMTDMGNMKMESSSLDAMFASMMISHHQDGIKMSQEYLKVGKNEELKKVAQNIITSQPKEIQELQQWLSNKK